MLHGDCRAEKMCRCAVGMRSLWGVGCPFSGRSRCGGNSMVLVPACLLSSLVPCPLAFNVIREVCLLLKTAGRLPHEVTSPSFCPGLHSRSVGTSAPSPSSLSSIRSLACNAVCLSVARSKLCFFIPAFLRPLLILPLLDIPLPFVLSPTHRPLLPSPSFAGRRRRYLLQ